MNIHTEYVNVSIDLFVIVCLIKAVILPQYIPWAN